MEHNLYLYAAEQDSRAHCPMLVSGQVNVHRKGTLSSQVVVREKAHCQLRDVECRSKLAQMWYVYELQLVLPVLHPGLKSWRRGYRAGHAKLKVGLASCMTDLRAWLICGILQPALLPMHEMTNHRLASILCLLAMLVSCALHSSPVDSKVSDCPTTATGRGC